MRRDEDFHEREIKKGEKTLSNFYRALRRRNEN